MLEASSCRQFGTSWTCSFPSFCFTSLSFRLFALSLSFSWSGLPLPSCLAPCMLARSAGCIVWRREDWKEMHVTLNALWTRKDCATPAHAAASPQTPCVLRLFLLRASCSRSFLRLSPEDSPRLQSDCIGCSGCMHSLSFLSHLPE